MVIENVAHAGPPPDPVIFVMIAIAAMAGIMSGHAEMIQTVCQCGAVALVVMAAIRLVRGQ